MWSKLIIMTGGLFALGAGLMALSHRLHQTAVSDRRADWVKYVVFLLIVSVVLLTAYGGYALITGLVTALVLLGTLEFYNCLKAISARPALACLVFSLGLSLCLAHLLFLDSASLSPVLAFLFLLVAVNDSFSQLWGKLAGRHKLCPHLSPGKTWEGLMGGLLTTVVGAGFLAFLTPEPAVSTVMGIGAVIAVSATAGDLFFSFIKRRLNIKDFSGILPGHGGILDRFDSLVIAAPAFYWITRLVFK
jgi:phosphatidate cytidylyltransferase